MIGVGLSHEAAEAAAEFPHLLDVRFSRRDEPAHRGLDVIDPSPRQLTREPTELEAEMMQPLALEIALGLQKMGRGDADEEGVESERSDQRDDGPAPLADDCGSERNIAHCVSTSAGPKTSGSRTTTLIGRPAMLGF